MKNNRRLLPDQESWDFRKVSEIRSGHKMLGDYVFLPTPHWDAWDGVIDLAELVSFETHTRGGNCWKKDDQFIWWRFDRKVPRYLTIDEEFGFLLGLFLAEGSTSGHQTAFGLHTKELYIQEFIGRVAKSRFNALSGESIDGNSRRFWVSTVPGSRIFRQFGKSVTKGLPISWMGLALPIRLAMVRGWLVGDGNLSSGKTKTQAHLKGATISRKLLYQMLWTLREIGISPSVYPMHPNPNSFGAYMRTSAGWLT
jgi:hypothetical protein